MLAAEIRIFYDAAMKPAMTPQQALLSGSELSPLALYREMAVGPVSFPAFIYYELSQLLLSNLPGIIGLAARSIFYPALFKECGKRPAIGRGVLLRNPAKVSIGRRCLMDDFAVIDARGPRAEVSLGDHVSIGRSSAIVAKDAAVIIGSGVNIGSGCRIASQSRIEIGESTLVAAYCYIGPGNHGTGEPGKKIIEQKMEIRGGVKIGANVWIGARATILDGVTTGDGAIIGAHSLVREDVPAGATAVGTPARVISR